MNKLKNLWSNIKNAIWTTDVDKFLHIIAGTYIFQVLNQICIHAIPSLTTVQNAAIALGGSIVIAILKELYDKFIKHEKFDSADAAATIIASAFSFGIASV